MVVYLSDRFQYLACGPTFIYTVVSCPDEVDLFIYCRCNHPEAHQFTSLIHAFCYILRYIFCKSVASFHSVPERVTTWDNLENESRMIRVRNMGNVEQIVHEKDVVFSVWAWICCGYCHESLLERGVWVHVFDISLMYVTLNSSVRYMLG